LPVYRKSGTERTKSPSLHSISSIEIDYRCSMGFYAISWVLVHISVSSWDFYFESVCYFVCAVHSCPKTCCIFMKTGNGLWSSVLFSFSRLYARILDCFSCDISWFSNHILIEWWHSTSSAPTFILMLLAEPTPTLPLSLIFLRPSTESSDIKRLLVCVLSSRRLSVHLVKI